MNDFRFTEPTCSLCKAYDDRLLDSRYCSGGKGKRRFRSSDPKIKAPKWCPKRNTPPIVRVYGFKDADAEYMDSLFNDKASPSLVIAHRYKVVFETRGFINAKDFYERANSESRGNLIDFDLSYRNVVEIDDGIQPYYFYYEDYMKFTHLAFFNPPATVDSDTKAAGKRKKAAPAGEKKMKGDLSNE